MKISLGAVALVGAGTGLHFLIVCVRHQSLVND